MVIKNVIRKPSKKYLEMDSNRKPAKAVRHVNWEGKKAWERK